MSKELKKLQNQRKGYQLNASRHLKATAELVAAELTAEDADRLRVEIESLREYQQKLENLNSLILDNLEDDDELEREALNSADNFEKLLSAIKTAENKLLKFSVVPKSHADEDGDSVRSSSGPKNATKLPKLEIAHFDGDPIKWQEFWDTFETTIDQRSDLEDIDKLKYLKSFLSSDALHVVDGFRLTAANYKIVVDTLKERFGNPEIAIHAHFEKLLALPSGQNESIKLQQVYDECEKHIRSLVALGLKEDTFGKVFTPIILSKLPRGIRVQICRSNGSQPWELNRLRELMREEISAREMSNRYSDAAASSSGSNPAKKKSNPPLSKPFPPTQSSFSRPSSEPKSKVACVYCGNDHFADSCNVYRTVDQRKARLDGRCLRCLGSGHRFRDCRRKIVCFHCKKDTHHSSLCFGKFGGMSKPKPSSVSNGDRSRPKQNPASNNPDAASMMQTGRQVQMQIASVHFPSVNVSARVFFDSGSSRSYVTSRLADALGLKSTGRETITSTKFGDRRRKTESFALATVAIPTLDGSSVEVSALVTDHICCPIQKYPVSVEDNPVLRLLPLADEPSGEVHQVDIDVLIGQDYYFDFVGSERLVLKNGMFLVESKLGYMMTGRVQRADSENDTSSVMMLRLSSNPDEQLSQFWSLEDIGIKDNPYDKDDEIALKQFNDSVRFCGDQQRYEVAWPWKPNRPELPTNYGLAVGCLKSLISRIGSKKEVISLYDATIRDQLEREVIETVDPAPTSNTVHYIPHHPVVRQDKSTTKLRIVYNASARCGKNQPSLNDCLLRGPVFLADLCGMLMRFRLHQIAISCDIEKAFLQIQLQEQERDCTRFLWLKDVSQPVSKANLVAYRFRRVPFGFISSPFLLQASVKYHLQQKQSAVATDILNNIYMDNVITGVDSVAAAMTYYSQSKLIFADISMNLREWYSNNKEFVGNIGSKDLGIDRTPKVLGLKWDTEGDSLSCDSYKPLLESTAVTKRTILQSIATLFDPCGFFTPVTILGKMLVQELWIGKVQWDEPVSQSYGKRFRELSDHLTSIRDVKLPRVVNGSATSASTSNEMHCFCDASKKAYATAVYLRTVNSNVETTLILSKARLAPIKAISLPRLELLAVIIGVRAANHAHRELGICVNRVVVWSDSKCVLHWVHSNKVLSTFVQNRIDEIRQSGFEFRYIQTSLNPADLPTRGIGLSDLMESELWWRGPKFLVLQQAMWPENEFETPATAATEEKPAVTLAVVATSLTGIGNVIDIIKFSSLSKVLRVTAWVLRLVVNCRRALKSQNLTLSASEISSAKFKWIAFVQDSSLDETGQVPKSLERFGLYRDSNGIVRCRGRLQNSGLPETTTDPIWLPKNCHFTKLTIVDCHERLFHAGVRHTLAQLRMDFWIPHGRSQVQKAIRGCIICRKADGGPFKMPESPPLPAFRVTRSEPFSTTGIDYMGPLVVRPTCDCNAAPLKVWICLFTCAATRALHLDVITSCSTNDFLLCLRRFAALYGCPRLIITDNAKHFKSASGFVQTIFHSTAVQDYSSSRGIEWKFIPALAPWMGGFYERLVGSVKQSLRKALQKKCLTLIQLQTVVAEISAIVNSRPLVPADLEAGELALTPAHFLAKSGRVGLLPSDDGQIAFDQSARETLLSQSWLKGQKLLDQFWNSWRKEYLASLRDRPNISLNRKNASSVSIKPGVIVLVQEPLPRACWRIAKIVKCHIGNDNEIRSATVQLANGRKIDRPLKLLHPIEDSCNATEVDLDEPKIYENKAERKASIRAKAAIRQQLRAEDAESEDDV